MPSPWVWFFLPLHLGLNISFLVYLVLTGRGAPALRAKVDALRGLRAVTRRRASIQASLRVPAGSVIRAMNRSPFAALEGWFARHFPSVQ